MAAARLRQRLRVPVSACGGDGARRCGKAGLDAAAGGNTGLGGGSDPLHPENQQPDGRGALLRRGEGEPHSDGKLHRRRASG